MAQTKGVTNTKRNQEKLAIWLQIVSKLKGFKYKSIFLFILNMKNAMIEI